MKALKNTKNALMTTALAATLAFSGLAGCAGTGSGATEEGASSQQATADESTASTFSDLASFTAKTVDGGTFTQQDLAKVDVTLVNYWSLGCGACLDEMPTLAKLERALPANVCLVTVCLDDYVDATTVAQELTSAGFAGTTLVSGDGDYQKVWQQIQYTPTTVAYDSTGKAVGTPLIGEPDDVVRAYVQLANEALTAQGKERIDVSL